MGEILVEGLGRVQIKGSTPTPEESQAIVNAVRERAATPPPPIPEPRAGGPLASTQTGAGEATIRGFPQAARETVEPAFVAGGATLGTALGTPAGPPGMAAGAVLGAAGGEFAFQTGNDLLRAMGLEPLPGAVEPGPQNERLLQGINRAAGEAAMEAGTLGVAPLTLGVKNFLTPGFGKIMGVRNEAAREMRRLAARQGVELAAIDVGGAVPKGLGKVLGIFPFTGTPVRQQEQRVMGQIGERTGEILNKLAPTATTASVMGMDMFKAAQGVARDFTQVSARLYDNFRKTARTLPVPAVPTKDTTEAIRGYVRDFRLGEIEITDAAGNSQVLNVPHTEEFENFLKAAENLPEHITIDQWIRLEDMFESFVDTVSPDGFVLKRVAEIKAAMEADLNNIANGLEDQINPETLQLLRSQKQEADTLWSTGMALFQTPTGQRLSRVDRRLFRPGAPRPGNIDADQLFRPVFKADSAESLISLRKLIGRDVFNRARRLHFENTISDSFVTRKIGGDEVEVFDLDRFAKKLGLLEGTKDRTAALAEMLKNSGVSVDDLKEFTANARAFEAADPSQFVTRRVILGGAEALAAVGGAGAALATGNVGLLGATAATLAARGLSEAIARPSILKKMTRAFAPDLTDVQRRALFLRLARELGLEDQNRPVAIRPTQ